jgi:hypothetical protein
VIDRWVNQSPTTYQATVPLAGEHTITMEYYENTGGATAKLQIEPIGCAAEQWRGQYFNNMSLDGDPVLVRCDDAIDFAWGSGSPDPLVNVNHFSVRWTRTGTFQPADYLITTTTDDGVRVWVDEQLVIDRWVNQSPTTYQATVPLAGEHTITMEYYENTGGATAKLQIEPIGCAAEQWRGQYFNNMSLDGDPVLVRCDDAIDFAWGSGSPDPLVNVNHFSVRWTRTGTFQPADYLITTTTDDGVRVWVDEQLVIDRWVNQSPTTYQATVPLAGEHTITMEYYENTGGATAMLDINRG